MILYRSTKTLTSNCILLITLALSLTILPPDAYAQGSKPALPAGSAQSEVTATEPGKTREAKQQDAEEKKTSNQETQPVTTPIDNESSNTSQPSPQASSALRALEEKDYAQALSLLTNDAEKKDPVGQYCLGILKLKGLGVERNIEEGLTFLQQAADSGNPKAQLELGSFYLAGKDVPKDYKKAALFLQSAATQGELQAQLELGKLYRLKEGGINNNTLAFQWLEKAATKSSEAKRLLAECYQQGTGVSPNPEKAFYWWKKAAEEGDIKAQQALGRCYETGGGVTRNDKEAYKWILKAASLNDAEAQNSLGCMYLEGRGVPKDKVQAINWLQKSASQGNKEAKSNLEDAKAPSPIACYKRFMAALLYAKSLRDILGYLPLERQALAARMSPAEQQAAFTQLKQLYISNPKIAGEKIYGRMARVKIDGGEVYRDGHEFQVFATEAELILQNGFWRMTKSATNASRWE